MRHTVDILGVPVDYVTMDKAVEKALSFLSEDSVKTIYTPNAEIMMAAQREPELKKVLGDADLLVADGAGVVLASKIMGQSLPERVAGFDLVDRLFQTNCVNKIKYFIFGGKPGVAEKAGEKILSMYSNVEIAGYRNGYFSKDDENEIIDRINSSNADILLVGLGAPKQEFWIHEHKNLLKVKICIGVGGSIDVFAGCVKRAPVFFQKNGLEWLYRLYKEPWRYKRMLDLPRFVILALKNRMKKNFGS